MPTWYTSKLYEGHPQTFEEFALGCARAFGALIEMRDQPNDAPIPERFEPHTYHAESLDRERTELRDVSALSERECSARAQKEYDDALASNAKSLADSRAITERYQRMLVEVRAWVPPTTEHYGLKDFMEQQLKSAMDFDDMADYYERNPPKLLSGSEWRRKKIESLTKSIGRSSEEHAKAHARAVEQTRWVNELRRSFR